jgi:DNA-binding YbaB/EbfC family protein
MATSTICRTRRNNLPGKPRGPATKSRPGRTLSITKEIPMKDIMGMMGKIKDMQSKMERMQEELAELECEGVAGGGMVTVRLTGKGQMKGLSIDPSMFKEDDVEILEDLIVAAHNDAKAKVETMMAERTKELTAGLPIPPGMKLPF